eukprot:18093-Rhodomonas_salina.1
MSSSIQLGIPRIPSWATLNETKTYSGIPSRYLAKKKPDGIVFQTVANLYVLSQKIPSANTTFHPPLTLAQPPKS